MWVDDISAAGRTALSAPHVFDVTQAMKPGEHTITVLIDNSKLPPVGPAHAVDERTQTNWNGIVGRMELRATDPVWIEDVQVYPDASNKQARVRVTIGNTTGNPADGEDHGTLRSYNIPSPLNFENQRSMLAKMSETVVSSPTTRAERRRCGMNSDPTLLQLDPATRSHYRRQHIFADTQATRFGMREFTREGSLLDNGKPVFLRGRLDCANYPLTGYAPMSLEEWRQDSSKSPTNGASTTTASTRGARPPRPSKRRTSSVSISRSELPNKRSAFNAPDNKDAAIHNIDFLDGDKRRIPRPPSTTTASARATLIFRQFGNSPSFVMFTLGNELGRNPGMFDLVAHFKKIEPRYLHAQGSNNMHWDAQPRRGR